MKLSSIINHLVQETGGLRALSRASGVDAAYISRMLSGMKYNPSEEILMKLGIKQEVSYYFESDSSDNRLMRFYGVSTRDDLIKAQELHIERLQSKQTVQNGLVRTHVREG